MNRTRIYVVVGVLVAFAAVGGYIIFSHPATTGRPRTIDVTVNGTNKMTPSNLTANENDMVTINIASDTTGEVHLHGYDIHFDTVAGQVVSHTFKADKTGQFEIEWESTSTHLGYMVVT
jgi:heme/copper-type cytochrome/quinol oxidase subunit 2